MINNKVLKEKKIISIILIVALFLLLLTLMTNSKNNTNKYLQMFLVIVIIITLILYLVKINKDKTFKNEKIHNKYNNLVQYIGEPTYKEHDSKGNLNSVTWMSPLNNYQKNQVAGKSVVEQNGLDFIKVLGFTGRKHHPIPADMYVIAGKYMDVPQKLIGVLKYASETINVEQLQVPHKLNNHFGKDFKHDKKGKSLVTGSCASVTISAITIKFVEDLIEQYYNESQEFREEFENTTQENILKLLKRTYDKYILEYLCEGKKPNIPWFNPSDFGEPITIKPLDDCKKINVKSYKNIIKLIKQNAISKDNVDELVESEDNFENNNNKKAS